MNFEQIFMSIKAERNIFLSQVISFLQSILHPICIRPSHHLQALCDLETTAAKTASQADSWLTFFLNWAQSTKS